LLHCQENKILKYEPPACSSFWDCGNTANITDQLEYGIESLNKKKQPNSSVVSFTFVV
jgi:hypothetical protein